MDEIEDKFSDLFTGMTSTIEAYIILLTKELFEQNPHENLEEMKEFFKERVFVFAAKLIKVVQDEICEEEEQDEEDFKSFVNSIVDAIITKVVKDMSNGKKVE